MNINKVSVAMAVYNGERYLKEQIASILIQLKEEDELVVSYDESSDRSLEILEGISALDSRVKIYKNTYKSGVVNNFQNAIERTTGNVIFLADQDDIWLPNKIEILLREFEDKNVAVAFHDAYLTDSNLNITHESTFSLRGGARETTGGNLFRLSYIGCCMAFRSEYKRVVLPIPTIHRSHDWWIGCLLGCGKTKLKAVKIPLIYHRQHSNNVTPQSRPSLFYQLQVRWIIVFNILKRISKKKRIDKLLLK